MSEHFHFLTPTASPNLLKVTYIIHHHIQSHPLQRISLSLSLCINFSLLLLLVASREPFVVHFLYICVLPLDLTLGFVELLTASMVRSKKRSVYSLGKIQPYSSEIYGMFGFCRCGN